MLYVVLCVRESVKYATILREQTAIENCEEPVSVVSVCESKEKIKRFFFSHETYTKGYGVSSRELLSVNSWRDYYCIW